MGGFLNTFKALESTGQMLGLLSKNQSVIANNIANVQTPNYTKQNTNFAEVMGSIRSPIDTTLAKKMGPSPMVTDGDGKVQLEVEFTNMQRNFLLYNMVARQASSLVTIIKSSSQVGR